MAKAPGNIVAIVLVLLLLSHLSTPVVQGQTQAAPKVTLDPLTPGNVTIYPSGAQTTTLIFKTILHVDKPPVGTLDVQLTTSTARGWVADVTPTSIEFTQPGSQFIKVTLTVPQNAQAHMVESVSVMAQAYYTGGHTEDYAGAIIKVLPRYSVKIETSPVRGTKNPQIFKILLQNEGNGNVSYKLEVMDQSDLLKDGVHAQLKQEETKILAPYQKETVELTVGYDAWAPNGEVAINVKITTVANMGEEVEENSATVLLVVSPLENNLNFEIGIAILLVVVIMAVTALIVRAGKRRKRGQGSKKKQKAVLSDDPTKKKISKT